MSAKIVEWLNVTAGAKLTHLFRMVVTFSSRTVHDKVATGHIFVDGMSVYALFVRPKIHSGCLLGLLFNFGNLLCHLLPWTPQLHLLPRHHQRTATILRLLRRLGVLRAILVMALSS